MVILYKATWQRVRGVHLPSKFHRSQSNPASYWMCRKKSVPWKPHLAAQVRARSDPWSIHGSDLFRHVPQMLHQIGIWGIWRTGDLLALFVRVLGSFLSSPPMAHCPAVGITAIGEWCYLVSSTVWVGGAWHPYPDPKVTSRTYDCNEMIHVIHSTRQWFSCSGWLLYDWSSDW